MITDREKMFVAIGAAYAIVLAKENGIEATHEFLRKDNDDETLNKFAENMIQQLEEDGHVEK